jgi:hypothetical protein
MFVQNETCFEYVARRLSEGWRIISQIGFNVILQSPEGSLRPVDLRNDVETLRPNAAGDETSITYQYPNSTFHWDKVDEAVADEDTTRVETGNAIYQRDLYNIANPSVGSLIINFITVYARSKGSYAPDQASHKIVIKAGQGTGAPDTVSESSEITLTGSYADYSNQWSINPKTGVAFIWDEIANLQIGIALRRANTLSGAYLSRCTQVYVEVDYAPPVATNAATGINPTSAILNGTLTHDLGEVWDVRFQWGSTDAYGNDTPWQSGFHTGDTFSQLINTLGPGTLYHFRAQSKNSLGTVNGADVTFWTPKPSAGKAYAFSRELHVKRASNVLEETSIAAAAITALADCVGINLIEVPSSLALTVEATYHAAATQGIKIHLRTSLTNYAIGSHTGADGAAALTDAEAHFVVNELVGLTIKNLTDNSSGVITANTETTVTATLGGGTDNHWDSGDAYIIEGAGYDTEDWDSWTPSFSAGSSIRQTKHYDIDPVYLKVLVENLDGAQAVTDVKAIIAVGT